MALHSDVNENEEVRQRLCASRLTPPQDGGVSNEPAEKPDGESKWEKPVEEEPKDSRG